MDFRSTELHEYISELWDCGTRSRQLLSKEESIKLKGLIIRYQLPFFIDVLPDKLLIDNKFILYISDTMIASDNKKPDFEKKLLNLWDEILTRINHCNFEATIDKLFDDYSVLKRTPEEQEEIDRENREIDADFVKSII